MSIRSFQMVKSAVRMSSYCFASGKWYLSMVRQKGSISQLKAFVQPAHSAARSNPPIPLKREAWVISDHRLSPFPSITPRSRRLASLSRFCRELSIYQFNESVRQIIKKIDYDNKMHGIYAGTVSAKDLSQDDWNWLTHK